jgi:CheY-like chemotaxis protein
MASSRTILVVDNDADARFVLGAILNHDGYHVVEAASGDEGVELARRLLPDLVLVDIQMTGTDGFDTAELLRADERTRSIPVVALTSDRFEDPDTAERARDLFHSWLTKPIKPRNLKERVETIIGAP